MATHITDSEVSTMANAFWEDEQDLTDAEQERIDPERTFEGESPDGAAASIESADAIEFDDPLSSAIEERAEAIQEIGNDPDVPDRFEDDVYVSEKRAEQALKASALRGFGAAQNTRGVESTAQWGLARVDDFAKTIKNGEPDDAEFVSDNDLLPLGHPLRSVEDPPRDLNDQSFVDGTPEGERKDTLDAFVKERL
jgi:hypothetical protein